MNEMIPVINRRVVISAKKRASRRRREKDKERKRMKERELYRFQLIQRHSVFFSVVVVAETVRLRREQILGERIFAGYVESFTMNVIPRTTGY